jgi:excinuclease UvrABC nuclease subunit
MVVRRFNSKRLGIENITATPPVKGVYMILDRYQRVQYVGKSNNLPRRLLEHLNSGDIGDARKFTAYQTRTEHSAETLERELIRRYCPPYNIRNTEGCFE